MAIISPSRATGEVFGPVGNSVTFGWITDSHWDPILATAAEKVYQDTILKLNAIGDVFNARGDLDFVFQNGDLIDGSASKAVAKVDYATAIASINRINVPKYHNIGNHEVVRLTKQECFDISGQTSRYYSFVKKGVTFIVLDGNYTADSDGADLSESGGAASPYVSYIPPTQLEWLRQTIADSLFPCIILCHYPIYYVGANAWQLTNAAAVREVLEDSNKVIGCIGGHLHDNYIADINGILYVNTHAVVTNAYPALNYDIITVYPDSKTIKVRGNGADMSYISDSPLSNSSTVNMLANSETFVQWAPTGATFTQYVDNDYKGRTTAVRFFETSNLSQHSINSANMNFTSGQTYTFSVHVKYENSQYIQLLLGSAAFGSNAWGNFDIQNGTLGTMGSAATGKVVNKGNGWYRISITAPATATAASPAAIFGANVSTMTRANSYTGATTNTRLISRAQVVLGAVSGQYKSTEPAPAVLDKNPTNISVGALRWDAWHHNTADTVRTAVQTSLGPFRYHWRAPFFASEPSTSSVIIAGNQAEMDKEIAYAVEAGLDYWAFFWYGINATNGMNRGWELYQTSSSKTNINWCYYFSGQAIVKDEVANNLASVVSCMQQSNYQRTADGRPLVFVFDDSTSKSTLSADISTLRAACNAAGFNPYITFHQSTPSSSELTTYGFDATTTYTPVSSVSGAQSFTALDTAAKAKWAAQLSSGAKVIPAFSMGWDRRPRVDNPVPWETPSGSTADYFYPVYMDDISKHIDACLKWVRDNPSVAEAKTVIGYAWNENDEGGWIVPTIGTGGVNRTHLDAVKAVLV